MSDEIQTEAEEAPKRRGRPPKAAEQQTEQSEEKPRRRRRRERQPLGGMRMRLAVEERKGFHQHWFNDEPGRVQDAHNNDYDHVLDENGEKRRELVGTDRNGKPLYAYLMEKPEDWYQEDQQLKQAHVDEIDRQIHSATVHTEAGPTQSPEFYRPDKR